MFEEIHKATGHEHEPYDEISKARVLSNLALLLIRLLELLESEPLESLTKTIFLFRMLSGISMKIL